MTFLNSPAARRALSQIASEDSIVSGDTLVRLVPDLDEDGIYYLMEKGVLTSVRRAGRIGDFRFRVGSGSLDQLESQRIKVTSDEWKILATYPRGLGFENIRGVYPLYADLCRLIIESKEEICITNPFFDYQGRRKVLAYLIAAAKRGVKIKIVSKRELRSEFTEQLIAFVSPLMRLGDKVEARTFREAQGYSVHAKFIVCDGNAAYLGSANLTGRSLSGNIETGVLMKGEGAQTLKAFFDHLWKVAGRLSKRETPTVVQNPT